MKLSSINVLGQGNWGLEEAEIPSMRCSVKFKYMGRRGSVHDYQGTDLQMMCLIKTQKPGVEMCSSRLLWGNVLKSETFTGMEIDSVL